MSTTSSNPKPTTPNAGSSDPTDGRLPYQCHTRYPKDVQNEIKWEMITLCVSLVLVLFMLFANWRGLIGVWVGLSGTEAVTFRKYGFYAISGVLGGIIFGMKYFYRVVARGYWHQDRRSWRIMSPFIAMVIAIIVGAMIDSSLISAQRPISNASIVAVAFLAGYFADEAVGKMYEIASVIFGKSSAIGSGNGKSQDGR